MVVGRPRSGHVTGTHKEALLQPMARIKMIEDSDAKGPLAEIYARVKTG